MPPGLPGDKQLRIIKIGDFGAMPDGGVQVRSMLEIGRARIAAAETDMPTTR
ncbi:MAG: hypothetical protein LC776_11885 [Acidobacteria bacterium]|nr:hypothetical protein [Acidobacteriota bacterium]